MTIPDVCLMHLVQFYVSSNEELATLTNVCRAWRDIVTDVLVLKSKQEPITNGMGCFYHLLLPSMLRALMKKEDNEHDTYCVSWFAGLGASAISVDIGPAASSNTTRGGKHSHSNSSSPKVSRRRLCVGEWFGYSAPYDILKYFGYSYAFCEGVIRKYIEAHSLLRNKNNGSTSCSRSIDIENVEIQSDPAKLASDSFSRRQYHGRSGDASTSFESFAVRGSTIALPVSAHKPPRLIPAGTSPNASTNVNLNHRAVQFLDAHGNHAVRMATPSFRRLVEQPVTIFLVGIACEDGCFFSGLQQRFECGHLYPDNYRDSSMDYSNVCISASNGKHNQSCRQQLQQNCNIDSDDDDELVSLPEIDEVVRGSSGPGIWHVYTCIFDHDQSAVRVDGQLESVKYNDILTDECDSYSTCSESQENQQLCIPTTNCGDGALDGLMIGSDHRFDMSLCDGGGYEGEGEGAIAELAVFKGRLHDDDIQAIERYLLHKYSIPLGTPDSIKFDEWRRQVHSLLMQPPRWDPQVRQQRHNAYLPSKDQERADENESSSVLDDIENLPWPSIPLCVAARHRNVAWHKNDVVTGKKISVSRIGSKSTGSSGW